MKKLLHRMAVGAVLVLLLSTVDPANAGPIYTNGSISGETQAWDISVGSDYAVTDSFTVSSSATLTNAVVAFFVYTGTTPLSVDWSIGTTEFGSDLGSGVASTRNATLSNTFEYYFHGFSVYESTITLPGNMVVDPGATYWLTLQGATTNPLEDLLWGQSAGASSAFTGDPEYEDPGTPIASEFFELNGNGSDPPSAPEPASLALLGIGAVGVAGYAWRRRKNAAT
jgi:hypothetical protein